MRSLLFVSLLLFVASLSLSSSAAAARGGEKLGQPTFGGWQPIENVSDPNVQRIARFAVNEHNKNAGNPLRLLRVTSGESQIVAGVNYRLSIFAFGYPGPASNYVATVWENIEGTSLKLKSFEKVHV